MISVIRKKYSILNKKIYSVGFFSIKNQTDIFLKFKNKYPLVNNYSVVYHDNNYLLQIYYRTAAVMVSVFASSSGRITPKTLKMVFDGFLLRIQHYGV